MCLWTCGRKEKGNNEDSFEVKTAIKKINKKQYSIQIINADIWREIAHYINTYYDSVNITIERYDGGIDEVDSTNSAYILICKYRDEIESIKIDVSSKDSSHLCIHYCNKNSKGLPLLISGMIKKDMVLRFTDFYKTFQYPTDSKSKESNIKFLPMLILVFGGTIFMNSIQQSFFDNDLYFIIFVICVGFAIWIFERVLQPKITEKKNDGRMLQFRLGDDYKTRYSIGEEDIDTISKRWNRKTLLIGLGFIALSLIIMVLI